MKRCPNCGSLMGDRMIQCNTCGRSLENVASEPAASVVESPASDAAAPIVDNVAPDAAPIIDSVAPDAAAPIIDSVAPDAAAPIVDNVAPDAAPIIDSVAPDAAPIVDNVAPDAAASAASSVILGSAPVLDNGADTYVKPPVFPDEEEDSSIKLTLGNEAPVYPEPPVEQYGSDAGSTENPFYDHTEYGAEQSASEKSAPNAEQSVHIDPTYGAEQSAHNNTYGSRQPAGGYTSNTNQQNQGQNINLTQQKINEQKQRRQDGYPNNQPYGQSNNQRAYQQTPPPGAENVTGTPALILSIIGLVLVVVFGVIGSCTGVAAFSLILTIAGLVVSIIGLVLANRDRKLSGNTCERANTAFVLSLIGVIIGAILLIIGVSCVGCIGCMACSAANSIVH